LEVLPQNAAFLPEKFLFLREKNIFPGRNAEDFRAERWGFQGGTFNIVPWNS
jgi:hypothetical protein